MKRNCISRLTIITMLLCMLHVSISYAKIADEDANNILPQDGRSMPVEYYTGKASEHERKPNKLSNVTEEMCKSDYWIDKTIINSAQELMKQREIVKLNKDIVDGSGTMVFDIESLVKTFDADERRKKLANTEIPTRDLYINGVKIDNESYFANLENAMLETGYTGMQVSKMGICTNRADLRAWPTDDVIGYSATDRDDEIEDSAMNLNEPFVIFAQCKVGKDTFYWGYSNNCTGWVNAKNIAICDTKEEWTNYWKVNIDENNFVVLTGSRINLQKDDADDVKMMLGTIVKLVPSEQIPENLLEKAQNHYIVYFAGNDKDGKAITRYAVLSKDLELNQGFLELNQKNLLDVAFSCHGDEYGWGGMNGNMDCSLYTRSIYKCFGFELPRNTTWQQKVPNKVTDISKMSDEEKIKYISTLPAGTLFYFPGHTMMFIGIDSNKNFVINDLGSAADEEEGSKVETVYSVNVNSLDVKRGNGRTWLNNLTAVVRLANEIDISDCEISISEEFFDYDGNEKKPVVTIKYNGFEIYEGINYKIEYVDNIDVGTGKVIIKGLNNFTGTVNKTFEIKMEADNNPEETSSTEPNKEDNNSTETIDSFDSTTNNTSSNNNQANISSSPNTGDNIMLYVTLMLISIVGISVTFIIINKRRV